MTDVKPGQPWQDNDKRNPALRPGDVVCDGVTGESGKFQRYWTGKRLYAVVVTPDGVRHRWEPEDLTKVEGP